MPACSGIFGYPARFAAACSGDMRNHLGSYRLTTLWVVEFVQIVSKRLINEIKRIITSNQIFRLLMNEVGHWNEPQIHITAEGVRKVMRGEAHEADKHDPGKANGFLLGSLKITPIFTNANSVSMRLELIDHETREVIIDIGVYSVATSSSLTLESADGIPIVAISWPISIR